MGYVFSSPAGLIALFALGTQAAIALILALATGLSELHKDMLVTFALAFPTGVLFVLLWLLLRSMAPLPATFSEEP